jgi:hypothetical protein
MKSAEELDLGQLIGEEGFTISSLVSHNGYTIFISSLADSRASGYIFINTALAHSLA